MPKYHFRNGKISIDPKKIYIPDSAKPNSERSLGVFIRLEDTDQTKIEKTTNENEKESDNHDDSKTS